MRTTPNKWRPALAPIPVLLLAAQAVAGSAHRVDGEFGDWSDLSPVAFDPSGDASDNFDLTTLYLDNEGTVLFLQFDTSVVRNLPAGSSSDGDLVISITLPSAQVLTLDLRNRNAYLGSPANSQSWVDLGWTVAPTFAADLFEAQLDLGAIGVSIGDTISVAFSGSDSFDSGPVSYTMTEPAVTPLRRSPDKIPGTTFRIASINTEFGGLIGGARQNSLKRIIDGVDAHVYCFQEEWDNNAGAIETLFEDLDPLGDGADWSVEKNDGQVIVARGAIVAVTELNSRYAAAVVEPVPGQFLIVLSAHLKCCGYINSSEDSQRIGQSQNMASTIANIRNSPSGAPLEPYKDAPVVVVGDYNLVGSETPATILAEPAPGLVRWVLPHLIGESITTWRDAGSSFWPGTLDVLMHSPDLIRKNGFVLDTGELDSSEAAALGVLQIDSLIATDHLMLVADFAVGLLGDLNADCIVDTADLGIVIGDFLTPGAGSGADLNGDGIVDTADLGLLIGAFGTACD